MGVAGTVKTPFLNRWILYLMDGMERRNTIKYLLYFIWTFILEHFVVADSLKRRKEGKKRHSLSLSPSLIHWNTKIRYPFIYADRETKMTRKTRANMRYKPGNFHSGYTIYKLSIHTSFSHDDILICMSPQPCEFYATQTTAHENIGKKSYILFSFLFFLIINKPGV